ncbi:hypothetical protein BJP65_05540 [Microbacterium sp. BH-3-3-3]|nr:hypothetical protein BJP65_05540 [Microbacterium sp. BH-3-3-3]
MLDTEGRKTTPQSSTSPRSYLQLASQTNEVTSTLRVTGEDCLIPGGVDDHAASNTQGVEQR